MAGSLAAAFLWQRSLIYKMSAYEGKGNPHGLDRFDLSAVRLTATASCPLAVGEMRGLRRAGGQVGGFAGNPGNFSAGLDPGVPGLGWREVRGVRRHLL